MERNPIVHAMLVNLGVNFNKRALRRTEFGSSGDAHASRHSVIKKLQNIFLRCGEEKKYRQTSVLWNSLILKAIERNIN